MLFVAPWLLAVAYTASTEPFRHENPLLRSSLDTSHASSAESQLALDREREDAERTAQFVQQQSQMISSLEQKNIELMQLERGAENKLRSLQSQLQDQKKASEGMKDLEAKEAEERGKLSQEKSQLLQKQQSLERSEQEFKEQMQREYKQHVADLQEMEQSKLAGLRKREEALQQRETDLEKRESALHDTEVQLEQKETQLHQAVDTAKKVLATQQQSESSGASEDTPRPHDLESDARSSSTSDVDSFASEMDDSEAERRFKVGDGERTESSEQHNLVESAKVSKEATPRVSQNMERQPAKPRNHRSTGKSSVSQNLEREPAHHKRSHKSAPAKRRDLWRDAALDGIF